MTPRPLAIVAAAAFHVLIGLSGIAVAAMLAGYALSGSVVPAGMGVEVAGMAMAVAIGLYGVGLVAGAIGMWRRRARGFQLAIALAVVGLVGLLVAVASAGIDEILLSGVAIWIAAMALAVTASRA